MDRRLIQCLTIASTLALSACGGEAPAPHDGAETAGDEVAEARPEPLDWARLLPFGAHGLLHIDMEQLRRSSHYALIRPAIHQLLEEEAGGDAAAAEWEALVSRTNRVMVSLSGSEESGEGETSMLFARGRYPANSIERLQPPDSPDERVEVNGRTVWVDPNGERASLALIGDTLLSGPLVAMRGVVARTRMTEGERWPPSIRPLVERLDLERSTIALVLTERSLNVGLPIRLSAQAQLDERLVLEARLGLESSPAAPMMRMLVEGLLGGVASQARDAGHPTIGRIDSMITITEEDGALVGRLEADAPTTGGLIAELVEMLQDEESDEPAPDAPPDAPTDAPTVAPTPRWPIQ